MSVPDTLAEALERFEPVIGLEVHAQLRTRSKLFSSAENQYDPGRPNRFVDAYTWGLPGVLPVPNQAAVDMAVTAGLALGCTIHPKSEWARKQYFYPDLPKGYQISQYERPLCTDGRLEVPTADGSVRTIRIERIHMEEDAGKSTHVAQAAHSLVDLNRAGVPLIEIVSGPDLRSAQEAGRYLRSLRSILRQLKVCDGNMEEGSFRCDANVSIRPRGSDALLDRCELKNINSFRFVEQGIEVEILRQARLRATGRPVTRETRLYDSERRETRSMRGKEEAQDYRYFPDPDLPLLAVSQARIDELAAALPELPAARQARWMTEHHLPEEHAHALNEDPELAAYFDRAVRAFPEGALGIANVIKVEVLRELKDDLGALEDAKLTPEMLARLVELKAKDTISSTQQKKLFARLWASGGDLEALVSAEGGQVEDPSVLMPLIAQVLADNPKAVAQYRGGKTNTIGFFVGQVMKATQGKAKPPLVKALLEGELGKET